MQVKTNKQIGQYKEGEILDVMTDKDVQQLVQDNKPVTVLTETRAKQLLEAGVVTEYTTPKASKIKAE